LVLTASQRTEMTPKK